MENKSLLPGEPLSVTSTVKLTLFLLFLPVPTMWAELPLMVKVVIRVEAKKIPDAESL
jgi:hypothetical protein